MLFSLAGLLGAFGIGVGAAGTHAGGGDLARLASEFLLVHAAAVLGLGVAAGMARSPWPFVTAGLLLAAGVSAFGADLAALAFGGVHLFRFLAPMSGMAMVLGWIAVAVLPWFTRTKSSAGALSAAPRLP